MVEGETLRRAVVGVVGAGILVAFILAGGSGVDPFGSPGLTVIAGIAVFIIYLTVAGYWLSED